MMVMVERMIVEDDDDDDDDGDMLVFGSILPLGELNVNPPPPREGVSWWQTSPTKIIKAKWDQLTWNQGINTRHKDVETKVTSAWMTPSLVSIYIYIDLWGLLPWINFSVSWPSLLLINTLLFILLGISPLLYLLCLERELAFYVYDGMNICRHLHIVYCLSIYLSEKPQVISFIWP